MDPIRLYSRYQALQGYVGWSDADARRVAAAAALIEPAIPALIDDFYEEIARHPEAAKVITGGEEQIDRLKKTLQAWVRELLAGPYDGDYVTRRWRVGWRHVDIGLDQVYTNAALSRLRSGMTQVLRQRWADTPPPPECLLDTLGSLNKLLDLDLAIIEDAYQSEYQNRQQHTERLAGIGQMAGGVAHELRQPLNVIRSSVYFLRHARSLTPEKMGEHLERIERQVNLANTVITAMADFARMPQPDLKPVAVAGCVGSILETTRLPEGVAVRLEGLTAAPPILADASQLSIAFGNLIRNARDAMPEGGTLTISAHESAGHVGITFADTGAGINPEDLDRIMEPMFTTKSRGIGLGLTLTRGIIDKHGGKLRVRSEPGQGAQFTVILPMAMEGIQTAGETLTGDVA